VHGWVARLTRQEQSQRYARLSRTLSEAQIKSIVATSTAQAQSHISSNNNHNATLSPRRPSMSMSLVDHHVDSTIEPFRIGIIGCGLMGKAILAPMQAAKRTLCLHNLAHFTKLRIKVLPNENLYVSSRLPESLLTISASGVHTVSNETIFEKCHLIFLCCLPHQVKFVASSARNRLRASTQLVSVVAGLSIDTSAL
jgi:hypothetical protein